MNLRTLHLQHVGRFATALLLATWTWAAGAGSAAPAAGAATQGQDAFVTVGENSAEVHLPAPRRYAIIVQEAGQVQRLYARANVVFHPRDPSRSWTVGQVNAGAVVLRDNRSQGSQMLEVGRSIPGSSGLTVAGTVVLERLQYRARVVDRLVDPAPVLVAVAGSRAIVEVEIPRAALTALQPLASGQDTPSSEVTAGSKGSASPAAKRRKLDPELFAEIPVEEVEPNTYEVDAEDVQAAIDNVGQVLADFQAMIVPTFSLQHGLRLNVKSAVVDGTLSQSGFTVKRIGVAQSFGIQVGDTITSLNGHPVNSPRHAWWTYQEIFIRNRSLTKVRVKIIRDGALLTKTDRIR